MQILRASLVRLPFVALAAPAAAPSLLTGPVQ